MERLTTFDELSAFAGKIGPQHRALAAFRAAARCLALVAKIDDLGGDHPIHHEVLGAFRALTIAQLMGTYPEHDDKRLKENAVLAAAASQNGLFVSDGHRHAASSISLAAESYWKEQLFFACLVERIFTAREFSPDLAIAPIYQRGKEVELAESDYPLVELQRDLGLLNEGIGKEDLFRSLELEPHALAAWRQFSARAQNNKEWNFWVRWYEGVLENRPLPTELVRRVATSIDEEIWEKGPGPVSIRISEIETEWLEESRASENPFYNAETARGARDAVAQKLEEVLHGAPNRNEDRFGIGGNRPPVELEGYKEIHENTLIIWASMDDVKRHLKEAEPTEADIEETMQRLEVATNGLWKWVGKKADVAIDALIKMGAPALVVFLAYKVEELRTLIEALRVWISLL